MHKELLSTANLSENPFQLEYYVLESELEVEGCSAMVYGVEVAKRVAGNVAESRAIGDICFDREEARRLAAKMADDLVTPGLLLSVVTDYVNAAAAVLV